MHFLDAAGAVRPRDNAREALEWGMASAWGNPRRDSGRAGARALEAAREVVARVTGARREDVIVTSSLTQAFHLSVGAMTAARAGKSSRRIITSASSRSTILHAADFHGDRVDLGVDHQGRISVAGLADLLADGPAALVAVELANVEIGTVQPVGDLLATAHQAGVPVLLDASVGFGRTALPDDWDALVLDGAEWGCGFDIGFVVTRSRVRLRPVWPEDADAWFPGGVSPLWAYTAAVALEDFWASREDEFSAADELTQFLRTELALIDGVTVLGPDETSVERISTTVALALRGVDGEAAARALLERGVAVGTGSACTSSTIEPNHVLRAMSVPFDGHLRITVDHATTENDASALVSALRVVMAELTF